MMAQRLENPMRRIRVGKVVINIGVGKSGEPVERAMKVLEELTGQKPMVTRAKRSIREFGIHRGEGIGAKVTVRGARAVELLKRLLQAKGNKIPARSFDGLGNFAFGIREHIEIPGMKYRPELGIFGMDVCVSLERPGYRVSRRRRMRSPVGRRHLVTREEAMAFVRDTLGVQVV